VNSVILTGNLTKDPELKYGASGGAYTRFTLAVSREFKKGETDFISCTAFGKTAELIGEYLRKGSKCGVQGRLQQDSYEKDGQKVSKTGVIVDRIEFLSSKQEQEIKFSKIDGEDDFEDEFPF
jgi:single-strand DNA-binding protein